MKIFKKALALGMCMTTLMSVPVFAGYNETKSVTADGETGILVAVEIPAEYTVSIPATLALAWNPDTMKYEGTYNLGVKGSLTSDDAVFIRPDTSSITLTGSETGNKGTATLTQSTSTWGENGDVGINSSTYTNQTGTIAVDLGTAEDTFTGSVTFTYGTEFKPEVNAEYTGVELVSLIERYKNRENYDFVVDGTSYIDSSDADLVSTRLAEAYNKDSSNYIDPADTYRVVSCDTNGISFSKE